MQLALASVVRVASLTQLHVCVVGSNTSKRLHVSIVTLPRPVMGTGSTVEASTWKNIVRTAPSAALRMRARDVLTESYVARLVPERPTPAPVVCKTAESTALGRLFTGCPKPAQRGCERETSSSKN